MTEILENNPPTVVDEKVLRSMRIPPRYFDVTISAMEENRESTASVKNYISNLRNNLSTGRGLILIGDTYVGKTSAAIVVMKEARSKFHMFPTGPRLLSMKQFWDSVKGGEFQQFYSTGLLVMDDLGSEFTKGAGLSKVESLLSYRHDNKLATVITTNFDLTKLKGTYGDSLGVRFMALYDTVGFDPSCRKKFLDGNGR